MKKILAYLAFAAYAGFAMPADAKQPNPCQDVFHSIVKSCAQAKVPGEQKAACIKAAKQQFDFCRNPPANQCRIDCESTYQTATATCMQTYDPASCTGDTTCEQIILQRQAACNATALQNYNACLATCPAQ